MTSKGLWRHGNHQRKIADGRGVRRARKMAVGLLTIMVVVLGLSVTTVGAASAADGSWRPYGSTQPIKPNWHCGHTKDIMPGIKAQACAIRSTDKISVQAAVIVRNNYGYSQRLNAGTLLDRGGSWGLDAYCEPSGIAGNSWSVCFGPTFQSRGPVRATGDVQGTSLEWSPSI